MERENERPVVFAPEVRSDREDKTRRPDIHAIFFNWEFSMRRFVREGATEVYLDTLVALKKQLSKRLDGEADRYEIYAIAQEIDVTETMIVNLRAIWRRG